MDERPRQDPGCRRTDDRTVDVTRPPRPRTADVAEEIAPDVFCLGPWGRTQTNVYLVRSGSSWVLIDAGWPEDASRIERAAESLFGVSSRPAAILLTHDHPDHEGSALRLARTWGCAVYMHLKELPIATRDFAAMVASAMPLDRWVVLPLMRAMGRRRRAALFARSSLAEVARTFLPDEEVPGLPGWACIPTPGHTPGHVSFFRPRDRVLITGDALVTMKMNSLTGLLMQRPGLSGPPWYTTWNRRAARDSVERLARLEPAVLAGGHGKPMTGADTAAVLAAFARLAIDG
jgi:glyoxylase-like metal-dependent hydrolase (beta-lactamase superfamily II)